MKIYKCSKCGNTTDDEIEFTTDLEAGIDEDDLICEYCYDCMNEDISEDHQREV